jgi:glycosyltransferase involved in cell wall biosynthesis
MNILRRSAMREPKVPATAPELSVIVPTRNRPRQLESLLGSLARQQGASDFAWELVVVDDASLEHNRVRLEEVLSRWDQTPLTFVRLPERGGPARARNAGAGRSSGAVLLFADDDLVLDERALAEAHRLHAAYPDIGVLNGQLRPLRHDYYSAFWHYRYDAIFNRKPPQPGPYPIGGISGLLTIKRRILERLWPLYDESLPAREDFDLYLRLQQAGITSYKDDRIVAYHDFRSSWWSLVRQRIWYAEGEQALERKYGAARLRALYQSAPRIAPRVRFLPLHLTTYVVPRLLRFRAKFNRVDWKGAAVDRRSDS